ncbi:MAG: superoxide dismutase [Bacteroidales bacterium]|nr:superoxide dismutase [Bacteroidales bacterium]
MNFHLPELPYSMDYLEPVISAKTLEFHYLKHHQAYVNNLNKLTEGTDWTNDSLEELIRATEGGIFNNAAQVWNHTFYWQCMTKSGPGIKDPEFIKAIENSFVSIDSFKSQFLQAAITLFGSGWAWLIRDEEGKLNIMQGPNAWNPIRENSVPLLTCDVWEHAYYIDYQNRRPDYAESFWGLIDWKKVEDRFHANAHLLS